MAVGTVLIMVGAILETFTPRHVIGCFIAGRAVIGFGQGIALCTTLTPLPLGRPADHGSHAPSRRPCLHWRDNTIQDPRDRHDLLAGRILLRPILRLLGQLRLHQVHRPLASQLGLEDGVYLSAHGSGLRPRNYAIPPGITKMVRPLW